MTLDVTDKAAVDAAMQRAHEHFGRLDVVVNNAGYGLFGSVEEVSEQQARDQIETNLFGALWVTQAALPILREQGSGHVIQVSSIGGVHAFPGIGLYHASKWGLEGFTQALAGEVAGLGIKVTIVEPGGFSTDWAGPSAVTADELEAYAAGARRHRRALLGRVRRRRPAATGPAILEIVDAGEPPLRVFFGRRPIDMIGPSTSGGWPNGIAGTTCPSAPTERGPSVREAVRHPAPPRTRPTRVAVDPRPPARAGSRRSTSPRPRRSSTTRHRGTGGAPGRRQLSPGASRCNGTRENNTPPPRTCTVAPGRNGSRSRGAGGGAVDAQQPPADRGAVAAHRA